MENEISHEIIGSAIEVHKTLGGPGLMESIYEACLYQELKFRGLKIEQQLSFPVKYKGIEVKDSLRIDLLVEGIVIVEIKAIETLSSLHEAQLLTYLRLTQKKLGLLLNFGQQYLSEGTKRVVNGL